MLSPRLTNCPECADIPSLIKKIDCKLAELGNNLYNNISYMLNKSIPSTEILQLIGYRRILAYKYCNPSYAHKYSVQMIASRVIRLTAGCVSKCNELEPCLEDPCNIDIVPNPTTTSTSTIAPSTTTTSTSSSSTTTTTSTSSTTTSTSSTTTSTTTIPEGLERITFIGTESTFVMQGSPITNPDFTNYPSTLLQYSSSYSDGVNLGIIQSSYILNNQWSNYSDYEVTFIISETTYGPYRYQYSAPSIGFVDVPHGCFNVNGPTNVGVTFAVQVSFFDADGTDLTSIINLLSVGDYVKVTKTNLL